MESKGGDRKLARCIRERSKKTKGGGQGGEKQQGSVCRYSAVEE